MHLPRHPMLITASPWVRCAVCLFPFSSIVWPFSHFSVYLTHHLSKNISFFKVKKYTLWRGRDLVTTQDLTNQSFPLPAFARGPGFPCFPQSTWKTRLILYQKWMAFCSEFQAEGLCLLSVVEVVWMYSVPWKEMAQNAANVHSG